MILLDTHIWVRWVSPAGNPLPSGIVQIIGQTDHAAISAISCWEVVLLTQRNRIQLQQPIDDWFDLALTGSGIDCIPVDRSVATQAAKLPDFHRDPADRLIIATALNHNATLISLDSMFPQYIESGLNVVSG